MIYFWRENRNIFGAIREVMRVFIKIIEHRTRSDKCCDDEYECVFPETLEEILIGEYEKWQE